MLADKYHWGPDIVGNMTPRQQLMYLDDDAPSGKMTFKSVAEYRKWMSSNDASLSRN